MTTLHLLGLPHTQLTRDASVCAFTQKAVKFVPMMQARGWRIISYWGDENEAGADEHVELFTAEDQERWYGPPDLNTLPLAKYDANETPWKVFNGRAIAALAERVEERDIILSLAGYCHQPITKSFTSHLAVEWAAGYEGWCEQYVCFESNAWRHHQYGVRSMHEGRWYDTTIPNFFDPDEWTLPVQQGGSYVAFVGRMVGRKGPQIAAQIAQAAGLPIKFAGSGVGVHGPSRIECHDGTVIEGQRMEYLGTVGGEDRNRLMRDALVVIAPTIYIEPFGAVAVEAQLCGTPAITTDWGAFPETVIEGKTGFRMRTLAEGVEAVSKAADLDAEEIRWTALERYSLEAVGGMYERWFKQLLGLWEEGWAAGAPPVLNRATRRRVAKKPRKKKGG